MVELTMEQWEAEGLRRFGSDRMDWKFECPACHHVAAVRDWKAVGASEGEVAFSCIGRHIPGARDAFVAGAKAIRKGPCNYAGGGLFRLNPICIEGRSESYFAFATEDRCEPAGDIPLEREGR